MENYDDLMQTGYSAPEDIKPEDEFFHSIYISGSVRKNHIGITEQPGQLQIRGVQYNLSEIYFIITHVKPVLVKKEKINGKDRTTCFSYQNTNPWKGRDGKICPSNRDDRENTSECRGCRGEIIVGGILTDKAGKPMMPEGKPIFVFIRGRGIKSPNVYEYLDKLSKLDIQPLIFPDNPTLEKMVAKNKRHVTRISVTTMNSQHGLKNVFGLEIGVKLNETFVYEILKIQKKTIPQFNEKFDWSDLQNVSETSYDDDSSEVHNQTPTEPTTSSDQSKTDDFSFDGIVF